MKIDILAISWIPSSLSNIILVDIVCEEMLLMYADHGDHGRFLV